MSSETQNFEINLQKADDQRSLELRQDLEKQYNQFEQIEIDGEKLEIYDLAPKNPKTEVPVVMVPGWNAIASVFKENIIGLAELGRRVIAVSSPHGLKTERPGNYPIAELRKVAALLAGINHKGLKQVDAVSHSEAGIFTTIAAMENSDKFRNLVLVAPAGMVGPDNIGRLAKDFSADIAGQTVKGLFQKPGRLGKIGEAFWAATKATISDPQKTWEEVTAMTEQQIPDLLLELKKRGHRISIIHGVDDKAFPMARMQQMANSQMLDGFISVKGSHNEMYLEPHPFTELIDHTLDAMEKKQ